MGRAFGGRLGRAWPDGGGRWKARWQHAGQSIFQHAVGHRLSPFTVIPLMTAVVLPLGKLAEGLGLIDLSTMSADVASLLGGIAITGLWLIVGSVAGNLLLFVSLRRPAGLISHPSDTARA